MSEWRVIGGDGHPVDNGEDYWPIYWTLPDAQEALRRQREDRDDPDARLEVRTVSPWSAVSP